MHVKSFTLAAMLVALVGAQVAQAQYGPMAYPYGAYGGYPAMPGYAPPMPGYGYGPVMPASAMQPAPACEAPGCAAPSCSAGCGCSTPCSTDCGCGDCGDGSYFNRFSVFADFLYLRPRNAEVAYAVPINGEIVDAADPIIHVGNVQTINPDYQPGFRAGGSYVLDGCSMVQATYSQLDADSTNSIQLDGGAGPVLLSLVSPNPQNATDTYLDAQADQSIQFKLVDVDYKGLFAYCCDYRLAYIVGARYAQMEQDFNALFEVNGFNAVNSNVQFYGGGLRLGLEGERYSRNQTFFGYGRAVASLIGGEFKTSYFSQTQATAPGDTVTTSWRAGRLVTVADLELGVGWQNQCGNIRLSTGYMYSLWFNMVKNQEWINSVRNNNFTDPSDNYAGFMSFDGLTTRVEFLW